MAFPFRVGQYEKTVKVLDQKPFASKNAYRYYGAMHHGWAGARANLDDPENLAQFADVYARLATFYKNVAQE